MEAATEARDEIVIGHDTDTGAPVSYPARELTEMNLLFVGQSRAGKTSLFLIGLTLQLLRRFSFGEFNLVLIDGAGSQEWHWVTVAAATAAGRKTSRTNTDNEFESAYFDPFQLAEPEAIDALKLANLLMEGAALAKARVYGQQYFWLASIVRAITVIARMIRDGVPLTLACVTEYLGRNKERDGEQILLAIGVLLQYRMLDFSEPRPPEECVSWERMEREREVVYAFHPTTLTPTASYVSTLMLASLLLDRMMRVHRGEEIRHTVVIADEWQAMASLQFGEMLAQLLKFKVSFVLANQTLHQLTHVDKALVEVATTNCHLQVFLTPFADEEKEYLQQYSELVPVEYRGRTVTSGGLGVNEPTRIVMEPKLSHNQILRAAKAFGQSILIDRTQGEFREPIKLHTELALSRELMAELKTRPLRRREKVAAPAIAARGSGWRYAPRDDAFESRGGVIRTLYAELARLARGEGTGEGT